ncbi:MAG: MerR family transcriptional regulator [Syntrophomonadaceae bacterium]|nr:MerR family transcriptional regulator [Syntrophomonadaceae bacterium]MDD3889187.1 MerR family transcriptional regulator [Syntrophomonadaceae bacterium]
MEERFYKIGEVSELLNIEQHTLRYLENSLKLRINRNERGDRLYSESDLDTFKLVLQLKEKGLNTTAIRLALENVEETTDERGITLARNYMEQNLVEITSIAKEIVLQNDELLQQNKKLEQRLDNLERKIEHRNTEREKKIDEFLNLWKTEQSKNKSWLSRLRNK